MKCTICSRKAAKKNYCDRHRKAYRTILKRYGEWKRALEISWEEYLSKIRKNPFTGEWAKEVAEHLIESGEDQDAKQA